MLQFSLTLASLFAFTVFAQVPSAPAAPAKRREVSINHLLIQPKELETADGGLKVEQTCQDQYGKTLKKGEAGFESCLMQAASDTQKAMQNPQQENNPAQKHEAKAGTSATIKFGK